jgi:hypothetical protein
MTQILARSSRLDSDGRFGYNGNRPKRKARGIGHPTGSSRLSLLVGVSSWRQWLWPGQSLTQNTRPTGTTFGVRPLACVSHQDLVGKILLRSAFQSRPVQRRVWLQSWRTSSEMPRACFQVWRAPTPSRPVAGTTPQTRRVDARNHCCPELCQELAEDLSLALAPSLD